MTNMIVSIRCYDQYKLPWSTSEYLPYSYNTS